MNDSQFDPATKWRSFELLPQSYFDRKKAQHALFIWATCLLSLAIVLAAGLVFSLKDELVVVFKELDESTPTSSVAIATTISMRERHLTELQLDRLARSNLRASEWCERAENFKPDGNAIQFARRIEELLHWLADAEGVELTIHSVDLISSPPTLQNEEAFTPEPPSLAVSISIRGPHHLEAWLSELSHVQDHLATEVVASTKIRDQTRYTISMTPSPSSGGAP